MRRIHGKLITSLLLTACAIKGLAQSDPTSVAASIGERNAAQLEMRMEVLSAAIASAQTQLQESQRQMLQLQKELRQLREQPVRSPLDTSPVNGPSSSSVAPAQAATPLEEREQALEAAVKLHEQTKVESASKYPVRLTGLVLFNGFLNKGVPDNTDLPSVALGQTSTSGNGSLGGSFRQTILGIEGDGPKIWGASTSAYVNFDFFSSVSYSSYGTSAGVVRLRTGGVEIAWPKDLVEVGMVAPLISPLSPSSYATVGEPALAGAGNLWTWAPQIRYQHRLDLSDGNRLQVELGLWDSAAAGYNGNQLFRTASPAELSEQPAYESRFSYVARGESALQLGVGAYYSRQAYPGYGKHGGTEHVDSWAGTFDWRIPVARHFELSGEGYRGRALGGLGGGVYKDVIVGTNSPAGDLVLRPLNAVGGWAQFKTRLGRTLEANMSIGQDSGFASDFHALIPLPTVSATQLRARNRMAIANFIFRPKTYIILSPEYRRIWTWPMAGPANNVNVFTMAVGYQF